MMISVLLMTSQLSKFADVIDARVGFFSPSLVFKMYSKVQLTLGQKIAFLYQYDTKKVSNFERLQ